jgi:hypothetical protein
VSVYLVESLLYESPYDEIRGDVFSGRKDDSGHRGNARSRNYCLQGPGVWSEALDIGLAMPNIEEASRSGTPPGGR